MKYTNLAALPKSLYYILTRNEYEAEPGSINVTTLIGSPRIRILKERHDDDVIVEASDNVHKMLGTAIHKLLSEYEGGVKEQRFCADMNGVKVCGTPDLVEDDVLYDYKTSSVWISVFGIRQEWAKQLNVYRWLLHKNGIAVNELKSVLIFKDWSKTSVKKENPMHGCSVYDIPMWTMDEAEAYVLGRIEAHQDAEKELPECNEEERWQSNGAFAVHLNNGKRAKRVLDTLDEAFAWIIEKGNDPYRNRVMLQGQVVDFKGYAVIKRPDRWRRCEAYCEVAQFCDQWKSFHETQRETAISLKQSWH